MVIHNGIKQKIVQKVTHVIMTICTRNLSELFNAFAILRHLLIFSCFSHIDQRCREKEYEQHRCVRGRQTEVLILDTFVQDVDRRGGLYAPFRNHVNSAEVLYRGNKRHNEYVFHLREDQRNINEDKPFHDGNAVQFRRLVITVGDIHHCPVENEVRPNERETHHNQRPFRPAG